MPPAPPTHIPPLPPTHPAHIIARAVAQAGGRAWMVGGSVRDAVLGRPSKDIDLEVHGLPADRLEATLRSVGKVAAVGRSFGVFKVGSGAQAIDVALPRTSGATTGTRGEVRGDPHIGLAEACQGRDLTLNAIAADPLTGALEDPTGGLLDLAAGRLQAVRPSRFGEDPLRVLRVARFAATHNLQPSAELVRICTQISLDGVAPERIGAELERMLLRAARPAQGLQVLHQVNVWDHVLPGLAHTPPLLAAVDRAAALRPRVGPTPRPLALMLATLLHLDPKAADNLLQLWCVHRREGFDVRRCVLAALDHLTTLPDQIGPPQDTALRRAAEDTDVAVLVAVAESTGQLSAGPAAHQRAAELGVLHAPLAPLLYGRDLIDAGIPRGPELGRLLQEIRSHQLRGRVCDPDSALGLAQRLWTERGATRV